MPSLFHPVVANLSNLPWVAIIAITLGLLIGPVIIFIVFRTAQRRHELWHETARVALEKGQPLPPFPPDMVATESRPKPANDIRSGLILIAVGAGLYLFLSELLSRAMGYVGAIPGFIGVALLCFGLFSPKPKGNDRPSDRS